MTGDVWIVLVKDRHTDVEALPFSTEELAIAAAHQRVPPDSEAAELNDAMRRDGWVLYLPYGTEGDCVRVLKRPMDGTTVDFDGPVDVGHCASCWGTTFGTCRQCGLHVCSACYRNHSHAVEGIGGGA